MISFQTDTVEMPPIDQSLIEMWVRQVALRHQKKVGDIAYIFCNDERILEVNRQYLQHDYYTDIITFDYSTPVTISGDLFISLDTVRTNSVLQSTTYDEELHRVIIHGILHLCGINDKGEGEREQMEAEENEALSLLQHLSDTTKRHSST